MEEQNRFRGLTAGVWELDEKHVVSVGFQLFHALRQIQDKIGSDREVSLLEFLQAIVDGIGIPVHEKNAKQTRSVGLHSLRAKSPWANCV